MSGFFCTSKQVLVASPPLGFKVGLEVMVRAAVLP